jgi:hypothetical protein
MSAMKTTALIFCGLLFAAMWVNVGPGWAIFLAMLACLLVMFVQAMGKVPAIVAWARPHTRPYTRRLWTWFWTAKPVPPQQPSSPANVAGTLLGLAVVVLGIWWWNADRFSRWYEFWQAENAHYAACDAEHPFPKNADAYFRSKAVTQ